MKNSKKGKEGYLRSKTILFLLRNIIGIPVQRSVDYKYEKRKVKKQPFLIFSNHTDTIDPAFLVVTIRRHMRFVMSDHVTRIPKYRNILTFLNNPIIFKREKGTDELYNDIIDTIRSGVSVAMYPEGGKTSIGDTEFISPRNATLVKDCNCDLITFRVTGGYLKNPRWAKSKRKGPLFGKIANIYTKEELAKMSEEEIYRIICDDLYVNAYDEQRKNPKEYIGEDLAEHAEIILYGCPECRKIGTLKTKHNKIFCSCGFEAETDTSGFWHGEHLPFDNIVEWDKFQKQLLKNIADSKKGTSEFIFGDNEQKIYTVTDGEMTLRSENGKIELFGDKVTVSYDGTVTEIPIEDIKTVRTASRMDILLVSDKVYFEIKSPYPRSATKFIVAIRYLQGKENK